MSVVNPPDTDIFTAELAYQKLIEHGVKPEEARAVSQELAELIFAPVDADYHIELFDEDDKNATQAELRDKVASLLGALDKPTT